MLNLLSAVAALVRALQVPAEETDHDYVRPAHTA
jgi:hypothetical protein